MLPPCDEGHRAVHGAGGLCRRSQRQVGHLGDGRHDHGAPLWKEAICRRAPDGHVRPPEKLRGRLEPHRRRGCGAVRPRLVAQGAHRAPDGGAGHPACLACRCQRPPAAARCAGSVAATTPPADEVLVQERVRQGSVELRGGAAERHPDVRVEPTVPGNGHQQGRRVGCRRDERVLGQSHGPGRHRCTHRCCGSQSRWLGELHGVCGQLDGSTGQS
mmetsp:Transcript_65546/g.200732  ORF Transcript_65546/g.200732 Transcript_65546/m.200732 type:complete len:216 (+) Transcript_65546:1432-2079(+)